MRLGLKASPDLPHRLFSNEESFNYVLCAIPLRQVFTEEVSYEK